MTMRNGMQAYHLIPSLTAFLDQPIFLFFFGGAEWSKKSLLQSNCQIMLPPGPKFCYEYWHISHACDYVRAQVINIMRSENSVTTYNYVGSINSLGWYDI